MGHQRRHIALVAFALGAILLGPTDVGAQPESPYIQVNHRAQILGGHFPPDSPVTVVIDRLTGGLEDPIPFVTNAYGNIDFFLSDVGHERLNVGDTVTVIHASVTKELTVTGIEVLDSNVSEDTVWGIAEPGSYVEVSVDIDGTPVFRRVTASASGSWLADFSSAGSAPDEAILDFPYGHVLSGEAFGPEDSDGDRIGWPWWTRVPSAWVSRYNMNGSAWAEPGMIEVTIDDPFSPGLDFSESVPVANQWFHLDLPEGILQPGDTVTITDGLITTSFAAPTLRITKVNAEADTITGIGDPGSTLTAYASADDGSAHGNVPVVVGVDGSWQADFGGIADISYGWNGSAEQQMDAIARFADNWHVPPPLLHVNQAGGDVSGSGWPVEYDVTVTIDDPEVDGEIADYAFTVTPFDDEPKDPGGSFHRFIGDEFPIEPGHIVTASNLAAGGDLTKTLLVDQLEIIAIQTSFDTVAGWAPSGSQVMVYIQNQDGGRRPVVADSEGWWQAEFSTSSGSDDPEENKIVDLQLGTQIEARLEADADGDYVRHQRAIEPQPGGGLPAVEHTVGMVDPNRGRWRLLDEGGVEHSFWFGTPGDIPLMGDWDCDGDETPGLYRQSNGYVYLRNSNDTGPGEVRFTLGIKGDIPLAGDFNGDGCDTVAVYRQGHVFMTNVLGQNEGFFIAEYDYFFGVPGDKPFVGDFDGDGVETVGLHRESTGYVYFRQTHTTGIADSEFYFGIPNDRILAGDWNETYEDTVAIFRPGDSTFYFRNTNTLGIADLTLEWGKSLWLPVAGEFGL